MATASKRAGKINAKQGCRQKQPWQTTYRVPASGGRATNRSFTLWRRNNGSYCRWRPRSGFSQTVDWHRVGENVGGFFHEWSKKPCGTQHVESLEATSYLVALLTNSPTRSTQGRQRRRPPRSCCTRRSHHRGRRFQRLVRSATGTSTSRVLRRSHRDEGSMSATSRTSVQPRTAALPRCCAGRRQRSAAIRATTHVFAKLSASSGLRGPHRVRGRDDPGPAGKERARVPATSDAPIGIGNPGKTRCTRHRRRSRLGRRSLSSGPTPDGLGSRRQVQRDIEHSTGSTGCPGAAFCASAMERREPCAAGTRAMVPRNRVRTPALTGVPIRHSLPYIRG